MTGTEKQIAWAEDIKANYMKMMDEAKEYYKEIAEAGSVTSVEEPVNAIIFVKAYHPTATYEAVKEEMKDSDLYKAFRTAERGSAERKAAGKAFRTAVATEALRRLEKESAEKASEESAAKWIESRMH